MKRLALVLLLLIAAAPIQAQDSDFDLLYYALDLRWEPDSQTLSGTVEIEAVALKALDHLSLNLRGFDIKTVALDHSSVSFYRQGDILVIKPVTLITAESQISLYISYSGSPQPIRRPGIPVPVGWVTGKQGSAYAIDVPSAWYPVHNGDPGKARYSLRMTVPQPLVAVASGQLREIITEGDWRTYVWSSAQPLAGQTLLIDRFAQTRLHGPGDSTINVFYPADMPLAAYHAGQMQRVANILSYYGQRFGPMPFEALNIVLTEALGPASYAANTLLVLNPQQADNDTLLSHELAHLWFGMSISTPGYRDIWLSEGLATYAQQLWLEDSRGQGYSVGRLGWLHRRAYRLLAPGRSSPNNPFHEGAYLRGAWTFHALRLEVGDSAFFEILRQFARRFAYDQATTADFVALAEEISGQDLDDFFEDWLHSRTAPGPAAPERTVPDPFRQ